eukprot:gene15949-18908_t
MWMTTSNRMNVLHYLYLAVRLRVRVAEAAALLRTAGTGWTRAELPRPEECSSARKRSCG